MAYDYLASLLAIRDNLVQELVTETAYRVANGPKPSYTAKGKSVDWNGYVKAMQELIQAQNELVQAAGGDGGLYEVVLRGYT